MGLFKNIFGRIYALWVLLIFVFTITVTCIPAMIIGLWKEPKRSHLMHEIYIGWMNLFFFLAGIKRIIRGKEHFKKGENYIVVCNHNSFMDVPLSVTAIPTANKTIAKVEMSRIPVFGYIYKRGSVLVDRKSDESRKRSYLQMRKVLDMGLNMCIYPEGTRNKTKEPLQRFHDGAFRLATESGKSIIPTVIFDTTKVLPRKVFYAWPHKVRMDFLHPISPQGKTTQQLKEEAFAIMKDYYLANR
ncbi:MAG: 1-acyl-sn-glycerol-3-phosphate acyltransferase [Chitinophagaceae bacterium]